MRIFHINFSETKGGAARVMQSLQNISLSYPELQSNILVSRPVKVGLNDIGYNLFGSNVVYRLIHKMRVLINRFTGTRAVLVLKNYLKRY